MRDVVRTTILSKRWNNLWTTTPYLDFDSYDRDSMYHASEFVNRALILWEGLKIMKFKFSRGDIHNKTVFSDIDVWVSLCRKNGVQEFYLYNGYAPNDEYRVLQNLYSCSSLKVISLEGCNFENHGNVQWNQLKSLRIRGSSIDQHLIDKVMSGSPHLEVFILTLWDNFDENLSIRSTSLKKLTIERDFGEPSAVSELKIWCPNVETLDIIGVPHAKCSLVNVSSLTHLTLEFHFHDYIYEDGYYGGILAQILPTIQHVEKLTLSHRCSMVLGDMKEIYLLSPLSNCKILKINHSEAEYCKIADFLQIFPKLETLILQSDYDPSDYCHDESLLPDEINLPKSFLLQLKTVKITCFPDEELIFSFIEFLLKHASKLQKMVIRVEGIKPPPIPWLWAQKLLRMPRSSPTAELIFA